MSESAPGGHGASPAEAVRGQGPVGRFGAIGSWVARHPWPVLAAWAALLLLAAPLAPRAPGVLSAGGFTSSQLELSRAQLLLEQKLGLPPSALVIVIQSETGARAGEPAFDSAAARVIANVPKAAHVTGVLPYRSTPTRSAPTGPWCTTWSRWTCSPTSRRRRWCPCRPPWSPCPASARTSRAGRRSTATSRPSPSPTSGAARSCRCPLAAIALLLVFGSAVSAAVPLAVGGTAVALSLAIIFVLASLTPMSIFVLNLTTLLGLGLGVDYSLLMTSRFREELARRGGGRRADGSVDRDAVEAAVAVTVASAGRAVFFSGLTVLLGLGGLVLFEFMILRSVGAAGAIVVGLDVAAALTLLPALLTIAGPRIDALAVRRLRQRDPEAAEGGWGRLARWVMARPVRVFVPTLAILVLVGLPFLHARFNAPDASILPPSVPSRQAYDLLVREFGPGEFDPLLLAIHTTGPADTPANIGKLYDWSRRLAADPSVVRVEGIVNLDPRLTRAQYQLLYSAPGGPPDRFAASELQATTRGDLTTFSVYTPFDPNRSAFRTLVDQLRNPSSALAPPPGITVQVAGGAADVTDVVSAVAAEFPRTALFIMLTTYLVLFLLLRSAVLPLKALVMNSLSIVASFGALVWIFQDGNLSALLGFSPLGFVETTQPVILFCVLFGLSMDYEVFLLSRMKEVWDRTDDNREAVARGLERSGRIVTSAALIVVVVAGSFAFADIVLIKALGLGVAIAVALDATVVRALLVPATMRLLGDWNWWMPRRLARWVESRLPLIEGATIVQVVALMAVAALVLAACSPEGRLLGTDPTPRPALPTAAPSPTPPRDPQPLSFPRDEAPHDRLTEWWYYTGHLQAASGQRFGFEFVVFRAERGSFPVSWASHLALTDELGQRFVYDQRSEIGPQVDLVAAAQLAGGSASPAGGATPGPGLSLGGLALPTGIGPGAGSALGITGAPSATGLGPSGGSASPGASGSPDTAGASGASGPSGSSGSGSSGAPWIMAGIGGHDVISATSADGRLRAPASPRLGRPAAGAARHQRLDRLRRGWRLLLLLADPHGRPGRPDDRHAAAPGAGAGMVRPPVGQLHRGRGGGLGLVRGQPLGRHRPDPVAGARHVWRVPAGVRDAGASRRDVRAPRPIPAHGAGDGALDEPAHGDDLPGGVDDHAARRGTDDPPAADGRRPGAGHPRDNRGGVLGRIAGGIGRSGWPAAGRTGLRGAHRVRAERDGGGRGQLGAGAMTHRHHRSVPEAPRPGVDLALDRRWT